MTLTKSDDRLCFVYYCSGHGYGHATRVSAFARHLLSLTPQPIVHIVSSAPKSIFADSVALGAQYRYADIDPVIVQPLAYRVDRRKSVEVLKVFLEKTPEKTIKEVDWLLSNGAHCVLSDAAFLGCVAANAAGLPSVLITNFTFDSVYSYLSTRAMDVLTAGQDPHLQTLHLSPSQQNSIMRDDPIPPDEIDPLVECIWSGYRCANLLLRLPGAIPIPSFFTAPDLPSPQWIDVQSRRFNESVVSHLESNPSTNELLSPIPFPSHYWPKPLPRSATSAPLLVRSPHPAVYTTKGRAIFLNSIGVPSHLHDPEKTKILIVSFGGQIFHKPSSRSHSRTPSFSGTHGRLHTPAKSANGSRDLLTSAVHKSSPPQHESIRHAEALSDALRLRSRLVINATPSRALAREAQTESAILSSADPPNSARSQLQLVIPGAPPASLPTSPAVATYPTFNAITIPPTPRAADKSRNHFADLSPSVDEEESGDTNGTTLLPDESWIAVVCGVSKEWAKEDGEDLPEGFYVAPRDVYMPDLTAVADVLLGKLGYGTVSECVDACTPFVFVPRPLFIEEHGLRLLLDQEGVGVELSQASYEAGEWASAVEDAWTRSRAAKQRKRREGETGKRREEGLQMARDVVDWVHRWNQGVRDTALGETKKCG